MKKVMKKIKKKLQKMINKRQIKTNEKYDTRTKSIAVYSVMFTALILTITTHLSSYFWVWVNKSTYDISKSSELLIYIRSLKSNYLMYSSIRLLIQIVLSFLIMFYLRKKVGDIDEKRKM